MPRQPKNQAQQFLFGLADRIARDITGGYQTWPYSGAASRAATGQMHRLDNRDCLMVILGTETYPWHQSEALSSEALRATKSGKQLIRDLADEVLLYEVELAFGTELAGRGVPMADQPDLPHTMVVKPITTQVQIDNLPGWTKSQNVVRIIRALSGVNDVKFIGFERRSLMGLQIQHNSNIDLADTLVKALPLVQLEPLGDEDERILRFGYEADAELSAPS